MNKIKSLLIRSIRSFFCYLEKESPKTLNLLYYFSENDLYDFSGLRSTKYLQESWKIELPLCKQSSKFKGYEFLSVPDHVYSEKVKLNVVEIKSKQLRLY